MPRLLMDAAVTGLVTLVLTLPIVGFQMVGQGAILGIAPHFGTVLWLGLAGFVGRLAIGLCAAYRSHTWKMWLAIWLLVQVLVLPVIGFQAIRQGNTLGFAEAFVIVLAQGIAGVIGWFVRTAVLSISVAQSG